MQIEVMEWAVEQDRLIIEASKRWQAGELSDNDLLDFLGTFSYVRNKENVWSDDYGSADVIIRLLDDGILTPIMYMKVLQHIRPYIMQ